MGDLNLDRMRPDKPEGKLLLDLEVEQCFECLITKPTRTGKSRTKTTNTLVEVLLSNRPELFQCAGNYYPCLSDHALIYGILKYKVNPNRSKVITFRSSSASWHIGQLFDEIDDQVHVWYLLMKDILDVMALVKRMRVRDKVVLYMTSDWKSAIRAKRKATARYL